MTTTYKIVTTDGSQDLRLRETYASEGEAAEALRQVMGWDSIVLSDSYTVSETEDARSAYSSQEECDEDQEGTHAPRVVEVRS